VHQAAVIVAGVRLGEIELHGPELPGARVECSRVVVVVGQGEKLCCTPPGSERASAALRRKGAPDDGDAVA
jgi:hypothetical protein